MSEGTELFFDKGRLDLSGRHLNRYEDLMERFHRLHSDLLDLEPHATACKVPDACGDDTQVFGEEFEDNDLWKEFAKKWRLPRGCTFSSLQEMTREIPSKVLHSESH
jgi:hypothetical protein